MATLGINALARIRNGMQGLTIDFNKPTINAAAQAVEDFLVSNASAMSTAINSATSPVTLSSAQKKRLVAHVLYDKFERDKV